MVKNRRRLKKSLIILIVLILLAILSFSIYKIVKWKLDANKTDSEITSLQNTTDVKEVEDNANTEIINSTDDNTNPYWTFIKMNLIDVDFNELKIINSDTKGWIQVNGTNINYPFVQTDNNDYYLTHAINKTYNSAGWAFLDYRNKLDGTDKNMIIYAHGRLDGTMFGSLRNILTSGWLSNTNNYVVKLSTEKENTLWQVFSVYRIPTTSDYIQTSFDNDDEFKKFSTMLINRSAYNFNTSVSGSDKILTLSTCYDNVDKVVLHAKLIKREVK